MTNNKAVEYAEKVANSEVIAPKYVIIQAKEFLRIWNNKDDKYCIDFKRAELINKLLKMLIMPKGLKAGQTLYECSTGYQWLFYISVLCVVHRENKERRRYETAILEIARKNFKTYTIATVFILLFLFITFLLIHPSCHQIFCIF